MPDHPTMQVCIGTTLKPPIFTAEVPEEGVLDLPKDDRTAAVAEGTPIYLKDPTEIRPVVEMLEAPEGKLRVRLGPVVD